MTEKKGTASIPASYFRRLLAKCVAVFLMGLVPAAGVFWYLTGHRLGNSYGETFAALTSLQQQLVPLSFIIFLSQLLIVSIGIIAVTMVYSHRISGPLVRLRKHIGRFSGPADKLNLRQKDAMQAMADRWNDLAGQYETLVNLLHTKLAEVNRAGAGAGDKEREEMRQALLAMRKAMEHIQL